MKPEDTRPQPVTVFSRGPQNQRCACKCPAGPCEHVWDGPSKFVAFGAREGSDLLVRRLARASCSRCGMDGLTHDLWALP